MTRTKRIICKSWDPLAHRPPYPVPWSDTYATFYQGRKRKTISPTLVNGHDLERQIEMCRKQNAHMRKVMQDKVDAGERCEMHDTKGEPIEWLCHDPDPSVYEDDSEYSDVPLLTKRKEYFDAYPKEDFILEENEPMEDGYIYFEIVTRHELNQETANKAIEWYLRKKNMVGQVKLRFHWRKPDIIVIPVGI